MAANEVDSSLNEEVAKAQEGDRDALERVVRSVQSKVYSLALRMLWHPEDAKDATQDILLRIVTHLSTFRADSAFSTWVYRIAVNHLLQCRRSRLETQTISFDEFGKDLEEGLTEAPTMSDLLLYQEIRVGCTLGMLSCLDRPHRIAYILGEILEMNSNEAAAVAAVEPATFRKRLERARRSIVNFMKKKCGLANSHNACRCSKRVKRAIDLKRVNPDQPLFANDQNNAREFPIVLTKIRELEEMQRVAVLYRTHPAYNVPDFAATIRSLISRSLDGIGRSHFQ
jgi:RNA polymerase sigma factor (sigma-70 family)